MPELKHRIVSMLKGDERFVLRCAPGMEVAALQHLAVMAGSGDYGSFDWFDAAVLSYQLGQLERRQPGTAKLDFAGPGPACGTGVPPVAGSAQLDCAQPPASDLTLDEAGHPTNLDMQYLEEHDDYGEDGPCV